MILGALNAASVGVNSSLSRIPITTLGETSSVNLILYLEASSPSTHPSVFIIRKSRSASVTLFFRLANPAMTLFTAPLGLVNPTKHAFAALISKRSFTGSVMKLNPMVDGGPTSDCPRSASIMPVFHFFLSASFARKVQKLVFPESTPPMTITVTGFFNDSTSFAAFCQEEGTGPPSISLKEALSPSIKSNVAFLLTPKGTRFPSLIMIFSPIPNGAPKILVCPERRLTDAGPSTSKVLPFSTVSFIVFSSWERFVLFFLRFLLRTSRLLTLSDGQFHS